MSDFGKVGRLNPNEAWSMEKEDRVRAKKAVLLGADVKTAETLAKALRDLDSLYAENQGLHAEVEALKAENARLLNDLLVANSALN